MHPSDGITIMNLISLLFLFAVSIPTLLVARIWWLDKRCDEALAAFRTDPRHPSNFIQQGTP